MLSCESIWVIPRSDTPRGTRGGGESSGQGSIKFKGDQGGVGPGSSQGSTGSGGAVDAGAKAQLAHAKLRSSFGDHITYLNIYQKCWESSGSTYVRDNYNDKDEKEWCDNNFIRYLCINIY
jgi:hypothetical protein